MKLSHLAGAALLALVASSMAILALTSTGVHAADLPTGPMAPEASAVSAWDGGYLGINVGYGPGIALSTDNNFSGLTSGELDFSGWFLGGQAGYNFSFGNGIVAGLQGDIDWTNESGNTDDGLGDSFTTDTLNWTGALTGHVGYDMGAFMPYVLGGVALANNTITSNPGQAAALIAGDNSTTNTQIGYTAGVGIEAMLTNRLSAFAEARYSDYGTRLYGDEDIGSGAAIGPVSLTDASVRTGINFHF